jgi:protein TonB
MKQKISIVVSVLLHIGVLSMLQGSLQRRDAERAQPTRILIEIVPAAHSAPPAAPKQPRELVPKVAAAPAEPAQAAPKSIAPSTLQSLLSTPDPAPQSIATAPTGITASPATASTLPINSGTPSGPPHAGPARVELPSSDADYLNNPKPAYPSLSKRLGEQGRVVVRTFIGADGSAQKTEIQQSSGFDRLDQAALTTAMRWRYVPGKRAGVAEAMWFNVPFNFVLE